MTSQGEPDSLLAAVRETLEESTESLDSLTQSRLRDARRRAVDAAIATAEGGGTLRTGGWGERLLPAGALASIAAALIGIALTVQSPRHESVSGFEDLDLLQDLNFYRWLQSEQAAAG